MDLNHSYFTHQIQLMRAAQSASCDQRAQHLSVAQGLAAGLAEQADRVGATIAGHWQRHAAPAPGCAA